MAWNEEMWNKVVICLQISIFELLKTTIFRIIGQEEVL